MHINDVVHVVNYMLFLGDVDYIQRRSIYQFASVGKSFQLSLPFFTDVNRKILSSFLLNPVAKVYGSLEQFAVGSGVEADLTITKFWECGIVSFKVSNWTSFLLTPPGFLVS